VERLCLSISPAIFGSHDVKHALACLLFSGSRKELPDGARLRGELLELVLVLNRSPSSSFIMYEMVLRSITLA